ncbi:MAG TPA: ABC transporter permease [Thermoanaerobaculia bacterium]|nr:ABC transporter permease [Thermoanaerobaculia bacterium]
MPARALFDRLLQDLRYALRSLARSRVFTGVAILSLALGLGSAAAIFSLVDGVLLRPLTYRRPAQLVFLREVVPPLQSFYADLPVNFQHFRFWRQEARSAVDMAAFGAASWTLTGAGEPQVIEGAEVAGSLFSVLGVTPAAGRGFLPEEEQEGKNRVVVLTDSLWRRRFGASRGLLGKPILLDGIPHTVVGILPPSFRFPKKDDLGPLARLGERSEIFRPLGKAEEGWDGDYDWIVFARLRPGVPPEKARAEFDLLQQRIVKEHAATPGLRVTLRPLQEVMGAPVRTGLYALLAAVFLLLVIVSVNLANLLLARGSVRAAEFSLRIALGASRASLVRQVLTETVLLSLAGGLLGVVAAGAILRAFVAAAPVDLPRLAEVRLDLRVWLFACGLALVCGLLAGLTPALRLAGMDPQGTLRAGSRSLTESRPTLRLREILVGGEVALSALLLVLAGLLVGSLARLERVDKGFRAERAVAVDLQLPQTGYPKAPERSAYFDRALDSVRSLPGVRSAAFISKLPLTGETNVNGIQLEGADQNVVDAESRGLLMINVRLVSPGYFDTMGIPFLHGRDFQAGDRNRGDADNLGVAIVSARVAAKLWPGRDPLGRRFSTGSRVGKVEIVGVVGDVHNGRLDQPATLVVYVPYWRRSPGHGDLVLRTAALPTELLPTVRRRLWAIDPGIPVPSMRTLAEIVEQSLGARRFQVQLATGFALFALLLAALGIYGVVSYTVAQRRREIGVRMALGARIADVLGLIAARGLRPVLWGLAVGIVLALFAGQLVRSLLFGMSASDPLTIAGVAAVLAGIAGLACLFPALDAARTDPASVLHEG